MKGNYKERIDYEIIKKAGLPSYYVCMFCRKAFKRRYHSKRLSNPYQKKYGTKQLMALWAWHNFERHLKSCKSKK